MTIIPSWLREKSIARFPLIDDTWDCEQLQFAILSLHDRAQNILISINNHYDGDIPLTSKWPEFIRTATMELGCLRSDGKETHFRLMSLKSEMDILAVGCRDAISAGRGSGGIQSMIAEMTKVMQGPEFESLKKMFGGVGGAAFGAGMAGGLGVTAMGVPVGIPLPGISRQQLIELLASELVLPDQKASIRAMLDTMEDDGDGIIRYR